MYFLFLSESPPLYISHGRTIFDYNYFIKDSIDILGILSVFILSKLIKWC